MKMKTSYFNNKITMINNNNIILKISKKLIKIFKINKKLSLKISKMSTQLLMILKIFLKIQNKIINNYKIITYNINNKVN